MLNAEVLWNDIRTGKIFHWSKFKNKKRPAIFITGRFINQPVSRVLSSSLQKSSIIYLVTTLLS